MFMYLTNNLNALYVQIFFLAIFVVADAQTVDNFISVDGSQVTFGNKGDSLQLPDTHTFQVLMQAGDFSTDEKFNSDFSAYVPISNASNNGYLGINDERQVQSNCDINQQSGGVTILDIQYNGTSKVWNISDGTNINFNGVDGTSKNCSGAVTPWGTIISSEEHDGSSLACQQTNSNGYYKYGWQVEIDPATKQVIGKHYAMGRFKHENAAIHPNQRTVYQGSDEDDGYLFKFVAHLPGDLSSGDLYVYKDDDNALVAISGNSVKKSGAGKWIKINNSTVYERNNTKQLAQNVSATKFKKLEDVEIGPDGKIYFAVAEEEVVYYLEDVEPLPTDPNASFTSANFLGVYVGGKSYTVSTNGISYNEDWGIGNDNLAFDNAGNLWVTQDGVKYHIWVVRNGHTQANPKVEVFAITPKNSEPTGITFTPDNRFMFVSFQLNNAFNNRTEQTDAAQNKVIFDKSTTVVIARKEHLGNNSSCSTYGQACNDGNGSTINDTYDFNCNCIGCVSNIYHINGITQINQQSYRARQDLTSNVCIPDQTAVKYFAGDEIKLNNGFEIGADTDFSAEIKLCSP